MLCSNSLYRLFWTCATCEKIGRRCFSASLSLSLARSFSLRLSTLLSTKLIMLRLVSVRSASVLATRHATSSGRTKAVGVATQLQSLLQSTLICNSTSRRTFGKKAEHGAGNAKGAQSPSSASESSQQESAESTSSSSADSHSHRFERAMDREREVLGRVIESSSKSGQKRALGAMLRPKNKKPTTKSE